MTYNEWRDELKSNLLCVSDSERRRVLDYYAEAYADRREAGFSEREIIDDFGAPYDAAQRILYEKIDDDASEQSAPEQTSTVSRREKKREEREMRRAREEAERQAYSAPPPPACNPTPAYAPPPPAPPARGNYTWVFVLLCIIFCFPLFGLIMGMVGITIGFCVAPITVIASGAAAIGGSIGVMIGGDITYGLFMMGGGFIAFGVGIILCPVLFNIVKLMWKLFKTIFSAIKNAFSGKERAV